MLHIDSRQVLGGHPQVDGILMPDYLILYQPRKRNATLKLLDQFCNNMLVSVWVGIIPYYLLMKSSILTKVKELLFLSSIHVSRKYLPIENLVSLIRSRKYVCIL